MERCPRGLRSTPGKRVYGKPYRGFESPSLRHTFRAEIQPLPVSFLRSEGRAAQMAFFGALKPGLSSWQPGFFLPAHDAPGLAICAGPAARCPWPTKRERARVGAFWSCSGVWVDQRLAQRRSSPAFTSLMV